MFANFGRSGALAKRSRRKVVLVVVAVVAAALIVGEVIDDVVKSDAPAGRMRATSWTAAVGPVIEDSNGLGQLIAKFRSASPSSFTSEQLAVALAGLTGGTRHDLQALGAIALPPASARSSTLLSTVLTDRVDATQQIANAVGIATSSRTGRVAIAGGMITAASHELLASNRSYRAFRLSLSSSMRSAVPSTSTWINNASSWSAIANATWMSGYASASLLGPHRSLRIVAVSLGSAVASISGLPNSPLETTTTTPPTTTTTTFPVTSTSSATGVGSSTTTSSTSTTTTTIVVATTTTSQIPGSGSISRLQPTSSIRVEVVISNTGTVVAPDVVVAASVASHSSIPKRKRPSGPSSTNKAIGTIAPGGSRYATLPPLGVASGASYTLTVAATTPGAAPVTRTVQLAVSS